MCHKLYASALQTRTLLLQVRIARAAGAESTGSNDTTSVSASGRWRVPRRSAADSERCSPARCTHGVGAALPSHSLGGTTPHAVRLKPRGRQSVWQRMVGIEASPYTCASLKRSCLVRSTCISHVHQQIVANAHVRTCIAHVHQQIVANARVRTWLKQRVQQCTDRNPGLRDSTHLRAEASDG